MTRILKFTVAIIPAGFGALLAAHLWPDEAAQYNLGRHPVTSPVFEAGGESAYLLIYGMRSPAGEDPFARGRLALEFEEITGEPQAVSDLPIADALTADRPCVPRDPGCIAQMAASLPDVEALKAEHRTLLDRYRLLYQQRDFRSVAAPRLDAPIPDYSTPLNMQYLVHLSVLNEHGQGRVEQAWSALDADHAFWRRFLGRADTLIAKMICVAALTADLRMRGFLMDGEHGRELIPRLSVAERSTLLPLRSELEMIHWTLQSMTESEPGFAGVDGVIWPLLPYKPIATFNRYYEANLSLLKTSTLSAHDLAKAQPGLSTGQVQPRWHDYLVNPRGLWFLELAMPDFSNLVFRVSDLDALIVLVNLKSRLKANEVSLEWLSDGIARYGEDLMNPYYPDEPAIWDAADQALTFDRLPGDPASRKAQVSVRW